MQPLVWRTARTACTALVSLALATSTITAHADAGAAPNIPASAQETSSELPLPYEPWHGVGFERPPAAPATDLPPPLARPPERPRRPLELSAALATFLPSCGSGSVDDRACLTVTPGSGVDAALLYRATPYFAFGAEAALSGFGARGHGLLSSAGGGARFLGVAGRVYFADSGAWDPYVALTLGFGSLLLEGRAPVGSSVSTTGLGVRVAGGVDYVLGSHLRLGPSVSFSRWLAWSEEQCQGAVCGPAPAVYGRVLGFATVGLRVTASFGEVL
ncbi:MAG: hypothetical protein EOO73_08890 [Myxococcales bacterium]|nr:MAG: hypothetical protein EOO73_08890 [Myxococcales bacterium]